MVLQSFRPFYEHVNPWWCKYEVFPEEMSVLVKFLSIMWDYIRHPKKSIDSSEKNGSVKEGIGEKVT